MTNNNYDSSSKYYTVAITGSSGLLGTALINELELLREKGVTINGKPIQIVKLTRVNSIQNDDLLGPGGLGSAPPRTSLKWNPSSSTPSSTVEMSALAAIDTVVHLAGERVGSGLLQLPGPLRSIQAWSDEKKELILSSRVQSTSALAEAVAACPTPTNFIVASNVALYGSDFFQSGWDCSNGQQIDSSTIPDESCDTSNTRGFLAEVARQWEAASQLAVLGCGPLKNTNRLVNLRLALIMSRFGGPLEKLFPIFSLGVGGKVGSGSQYFSYISARDAARAIVHCIKTPTISGPVNLVAPTPCTNAELTAAIGKVLSRPTMFTLPEFFVRLVFGQMGEEFFLDGRKAAPKKLLESGFKFHHETIEKAIESAVNEKI